MQPVFCGQFLLGGAIIDDIMLDSLSQTNIMEGISLPKNYEINMHPEAITPPNGTYFIRGIKNWTPGNDLTVNFSEISCSLQKDGQTIPLRPYGYILEIDKGGIISAHDKDITSEIGENNTKEPSHRAMKADLKTYTENNLDDMIANTKNGSHNELIVKGDKVGVLGAYVVEGENNLPGIKQFKKDCLSKGIKIHLVPNIAKEFTPIQRLTVGEAVQMAIETTNSQESSNINKEKTTKEIAINVWSGLTGKEFAGTISQEEIPDPIYSVLKKAIEETSENNFSSPSEFADALKTASFPQPLVNL